MADVNGAPVANDGGMGEGESDGADMPQLADDGQPLSELAREILNEDRNEKVAAKAKKAVPVQQELGDDADEEEAPDEEPKAEKKAPESFKLKVGEKTYTRTLDQLKADAQRGLALQAKANTLDSDKKALETERAQLKHEVAAIREQMDRLRRAPEEFLRAAPNSEEIAEKLLLEKAQQWQREQSMTPQEREFYREAQAHKAKLAEYEKQAKAQEETQAERMVEEQKEKIAHVFGEALQKHNLPKNTTTLRVMAGIFQAHLSKGVQLTEEQCAQLTRAQLEQINTDAFGNMDAGTFVQRHPKLAEDIRKHFVSQARGGAKPAPVVEPKKAGTKREPNSGRFSKDMDPWERELEDLKKRGAKEREAIERQPWRAPVIG